MKVETQKLSHLSHESHSRDSSRSRSNSDNISEPTTSVISSMVYCLFLVMGGCSLMPWNTWITVPDYFGMRVVGTMFEFSHDQYISLSFLGTNLCSLMLIVAFSHWMGPNVRFVSGVVVMVSVFACTSALTQFMDMDPTLFFALTLVSVVLSAMATGCMSAVFALSAMHSPQYVQAVNSGQGIAGLIPSLSNFILQFYINENEENRDAMKNRAFVFFMITVSIGILTLLSHLILTFKLKKREPSISTSESIESGINPIIVTEEANLKPIFSFAVAIFFNFAVTLMLFPAITARVSPMDDYPTHGWIKNLFLAIHFLIFNIADLVGKSIPGVSWFHIQNKTRLLLFSYGRVVFVLLFLLCNVTIVRSNGDPLFPTYLGDTSFMFILFIFGMTSGWVSTNLLMEGPQTVPVSKREKAVNIMVFSLTAGLATGSLLSFMLKGILCQCNPFTSE